MTDEGRCSSQVWVAAKQPSLSIYIHIQVKQVEDKQITGLFLLFNMLTALLVMHSLSPCLTNNCLPEFQVNNGVQKQIFCEEHASITYHLILVATHCFADVYRYIPIATLAASSTMLIAAATQVYYSTASCPWPCSKSVSYAPFLLPPLGTTLQYLS